MEELRLNELSDDRVLERVEVLVARSNRLTAELLAYLAEVDVRGLHRRQATGSLFAFCVERLHMSEAAAGKRITVARVARRFPVVLEMIARGEIHLTAVNMLAAHLTEANHAELLARARRRSKRQVEQIVAEVAPKPDVSSRVVALPHREVVGELPTAAGRAPETPERVAPAPERGPAPGCVAHTPGRVAVAPGCVAHAPERVAHAPECVAHAPERVGVAPDREHAPERGAHAPERVARAPTAVVAPLSPGRYQIRVTVGEEAHAALTQLQDLLSHQVPDRDPAVIIARALELLLERTLARKAAVVERPREAKAPETRARHVPAAVRREVWQRDGGQCAFVDGQSRRCSATRFIEFHHVNNWARGAEHTAAEIELRCRAHNQYQAELDYGSELMAACRSRGRSRAEEPRAPYRPQPHARSRLPLFNWVSEVGGTNATIELEVGKRSAQSIHIAGLAWSRAPW